MNIIVEQTTKLERKKQETFRQFLDRHQAYRKAHYRKVKIQRRKHKRRIPTTEAMRWLNNKIFAHVYGEKVGDEVYPCMTKETFIGCYNQTKHGKRLPNYKLQDHFAGLKTYYYFASPNKTAEYALVMIDIDVQKRKKLGSPEGAREYAAFLRTWFPSLYVEPSTHGKGQHAYLLVRKLGYSAQEVKYALRQLETWLRQKAKGFNIELIEVKGAPPVIRYREGGTIESVIYGSFAKIPRDVSRFSEWANTTILTITELLTLPVVHETVEGEPKVRVSPATHPVGSVSGRNINQEELKNWSLFRPWNGSSSRPERVLYMVADGRLMKQTSRKQSFCCASSQKTQMRMVPYLSDEWKSCGLHFIRLETSRDHGIITGGKRLGTGCRKWAGSTGRITGI